ncbi:uncharacterized protein LOC134540730 [Bacillus rossius redtenbacheri]|uniref:uncharacterized protein LOC134540730 n=1 Tax=Bacillus rossius redtenbacheri TaxID=93214 RepID=UPI002FDD17C3
MARSSSGAREVDVSGYDRLGCLHEWFAAQAGSTPGAVAVVSDDGRQMSFSELDHASDVLAARLRHLGAGKNSVVCIFMERSAEYVVSYIGILKAGAAYLPLETAYPPQLLAAVLEDARPLAACTKSALAARLPSGSETRPLAVLLLEGDWLLQFGRPPQPLPAAPPSSLDDMAYTVYSSGTTGRPKGIQYPHRGAVFSYHWRHLAYPYQPDDREACNVFFVWECLRPLLKGIPLYIIPDDVIYDPPKLTSFLKRHGITRMLFTPSLLQTVLDSKGVDLEESFKTMRQVWLCGEVVTAALRDHALATLPRACRLLNLYSVSEAHDVAAADLAASRGPSCPAGRPLPGVRLLVLDGDMRPLPAGATGEVFVGGPGLATGYLNLPELTARRFVRGPPPVGERLYRTGDWGSLSADGELQVCGRCDSVVRIRGYSVELQAVEAALLQLPGVKSCCLLGRGEPGSDQLLVAYVIAPGGEPSGKQLRAGLRETLPSYMIPSKFVFLDSLPILESSGKLDTKRLRRIDLKSDLTVGATDLPSTTVEHKLAGIWSRVLNMDYIDVQESFFDLGGHSLLAARLLGEVNEQLGSSLTVDELFSHPSVSAMASLLTDPPGERCSDDGLDLRFEVDSLDQLDPVKEILVKAFRRSLQPPFAKSRGNKILLTGATGFVGAFILRELLASTQATVYCLVREAPNCTLLDRVKNTLREHGLLGTGGASSDLEDCLERRVILLKGDVSLRRLGLPEEDHAWLSLELDAVVHAAAAVDLVRPYLALRAVNAAGTRHVVALAAEGRLKPLHHVSTDAVFPHAMRGCREDDDMSAIADGLRGGYARSKWVAEQLVLRAGAKGLPVVVYRCGNVGGSQDHPSWNKADFTLLVIQGCLRTMTVPDLDWQIELTPVDFLSRVIVKLSENIAHSVGNIYHLTNTNTMNCRDLWQLLKAHGYPVQEVPYDTWWRNVKAVASGGEAPELSSLVFLLESLVRGPEYFSNLSTFARDNTQAFLDSQGMKYSPVDRALVTKYLCHLTSLGLIPQPDIKFSLCARSLQGRVALVTGASSGIGEAVARLLAANGAKVALAARRADRLEALQRAIEGGGGTALAVQMDVTEPDQVRRGVERVESSLGPISVLVNNAGILYYTLMKNARLDEWRRMVDVNVNGVLNCLADVLPGMVARGEGHIVNITSDAGRKAFAAAAVYTGTKYFLEGMSRALRQEVAGSGVKVTCVQPGDVTTEILDYTTDQEATAAYEYEVKNPLESKDVAEAVLYAVTQPAHCAVNEILLEPHETPI